MKKQQPEQHPKTKPSPSDLVGSGGKAGKKADVELTENELERATGGAIDSYIKIDGKT